jgi:hypothetical protein
MDHKTWPQRARSLWDVHPGPAHRFPASAPPALQGRAAPGSARGRSFVAILLDRIPAQPSALPKMHPCRPPSRAGQRACGRGHRRSCSTGVRATSDPGPPGGLPSSTLPSHIPTAPIATKAASLPPPHTSGPAGMRAGLPAIQLDRSAGDERAALPIGPAGMHPKAFSPDTSILSERRLRRRRVAVLAVMTQRMKI